MLERGTQTPVVVILDGHEAKRLQHSVGDAAHRAENFRHAVYRARLGLKGNFYKIAPSQRLGHAKQTTGGRNGLEFCFGAAAVF